MAVAKVLKNCERGRDNDILNGNAGDDNLDGGFGNSNVCDGGNGSDSAVRCETELNIP